MATAKLRCVDDDKVILEAPINEDFTPPKSVVTDNMKCILARHKLRITVSD
jgi:hypothetical protein